MSEETPPRFRRVPLEETPPRFRRRTTLVQEVRLPRKIKDFMLDVSWVDEVFKRKVKNGPFRKCHCSRTNCFETIPSLPIVMQWRLILAAEKSMSKQQLILSLIAANCSDSTKPKATFRPTVGARPVCLHFWLRVHFLRNDLRPYFYALEHNNGVMIVVRSESESDGEEGQAIVEGRGCIKDSFMRSFRKIISDFGEQMVHLSDSVALEEEGEDRMKTLVYLPCGLFQDMRDLCKTMIKDKLVPPTAKVNWLEKLRRVHFPNVEIKKWIPFAKCSTCWEYYECLIACKSDQLRELLRSKQTLHREHVSLMRDRHSIRMTLGEEEPELFLSGIIDGMDNEKTEVPICAQTNKEIEGSGVPMSTKIVGVIAHGHGFQGTWVYPRYTGGSSETITILHRTIKKVADKNEGKLPPCLFIQADNCGKENKNQFVVAYCGWLLATNIFKVIQLNFLLVGHTHSIIDQRFSKIHQKIKGKNVFSFPKFQELIQPLFLSQRNTLDEAGEAVRTRWTEIEEIGFTANFKKFLEQSNKHEIHGLGTSRDPTTNEKICLHSLRFEKKDGIPSMLYQVYDDSGPWYGHHAEESDGARPIPIFRSTPEFPTVIESSPRKRITDWDQVCARFDAVFGVKGAENSQDRIEAKLWWEKFKKEEEEYWERFPRMSQVHDTSKTEPPITKSNTDSEDDLRVVRDILNFFDRPVPLCQLPAGRAKDILSRIPKAQTLFEKEKKVTDLNGGLHPGHMTTGRGVFVWVDGDSPQSMQMFNPQVDVAKGQFVVTYFEPDSTTFNRGWEIALADSDPYSVVDPESGTTKTCVDLTYQQPATRVTETKWPEEWHKRKFKPMTNKDRCCWSEVGVDVDLIAYSTYLTDKGRILSVNDQKKVLHTIKRIEEHHKANKDAPRAAGARTPVRTPVRSVAISQRVDDDTEDDD